jgi:hypothetical protein
MVAYNRDTNKNANLYVCEEKLSIDIKHPKANQWSIFKTLDNNPDTLDNRVINLRNTAEFDANNQAHNRIVLEAIAKAKKNLNTLQNQDLIIMLSGTLMLVSYFVIPMWFISLAATAICAWNLATRSAANQEHQHSLKALAEVWEWAQNCEGANTHKDNPLITDIRRVLFPLITTEDVEWITLNEIEQEARQYSQAEKKAITLHGLHLNEQTTGLYHQMYGANQQGFSAFAKAVFASALVGAFRLGSLACETYSQLTQDRSGNTNGK